MNIGTPLKKFAVVFFLFIFFVEHFYFPISSFFTTHCKILTSHKKDIFISEIIFKIKKWFLFIFFIFFGQGRFENLPKNITRYKGRGKNKSYVFIISLSLPMNLQSMVIFLYCWGYSYAHFKSKYKWELTLIITQALGTVLFFNCLFPQNKFNILVTQGGRGRGYSTWF